jgi:hypothetical protein
LAERVEKTGPKNRKTRTKDMYLFDVTIVTLPENTARQLVSEKNPQVKERRFQRPLDE